MNEFCRFFFKFPILYSINFRNTSKLTAELIHSILLFLFWEERVVLQRPALLFCLVDCDSIDEILTTVGYTASTLMADLKISPRTIEKWQEKGFSEYEKYSLIFMITAHELFHLRYKTCQIDGRDYFSSDPSSDVCPKCATEMYKYFFPF